MSGSFISLQGVNQSMNCKKNNTSSKNNDDNDDCKKFRHNCDQCNLEFCEECDTLGQKCSECNKPFCYEHLHKLSCTCRFGDHRGFVFHFTCHAGKYVCFSCLTSFIGESSVLVDMKSVEKLVNSKDDELAKQQLEYIDLKVKYEFLEIKHKVYMDVFHRDVSVAGAHKRPRPVDEDDEDVQEDL